MSTSIIRTLDENGIITENATYKLDPKQALIAYLEQTINKSWNTWEYNHSKFIDEIKSLKSKKGYGYNVPDKNISVCAYLKY